MRKGNTPGGSRKVPSAKESKGSGSAFRCSPPSGLRCVSCAPYLNSVQHRAQYQSAQRKLRLGVSTVSRPAGEQAIPVWQQKRNVRVAQPIARGWMPVAVRARRDPIRARRRAASVGASAIATQKTGARRPKTIHTQSPQSGPVSSIANCSTSARIASLPSCAVRVSASTTRRSVPARTPVTRPTASSNSCG